jgi:hypothetical protein
VLEAQADWVLDTPLGALLFDGASPDYFAALVDAAPSAYFKTLETSGTVMTNAAGGSNGTYVGGVPLNNPGPFTGGKSFAPAGPASGDYATIPGTLLPANADWAFTIWGASFDVTTNARTYILDGSSASHPKLYIASGGIPTLEITDAGETTTLTGPTVAVNAFHFYGITCDGRRVCLWMDGDLVAEAVRTNAYTPPGIGTLYLGIDSALTASRNWQGYLSTPAIWSSFLAPQHLVRLYSIAVDPAGGVLRLGKEAPKRDVGIRQEVDTYPLADGGTIGDAYDDPAVWSMPGNITAASATLLQQTIQRLRGRVNSVRRANGTLYWTPSGFVPLQTVVRRGQRPDPGEGSAGWKPFLMSLISKDPRVYSQQRVTTIVPPTSLGGITSPMLSPLVESAPVVTSVSIVNNGDEFTPPVIELVGPYSRATLTATYTYNGQTVVKSLVLDTALNNGDTLTIDVASGRMYTGSAWSVATNRRGDLSPGSVLFDLAPGTTVVRCTMVGSSSGSTCRITHRHAWMP